MSVVPPRVAAAFAADWDTPAERWAARLWEGPAGRFEPRFRAALVAELATRTDRAEAIVAAAEAMGAVGTVHHVCPTNGPTFGAVDWLAALGCPGPILVLAWSGLPMSNPAQSGALCFSRSDLGDLLRPGAELNRQRAAERDRARDGITERRLVLVPPALRDALVDRCPTPARTAEVLAEVRGLDFLAPLGEDYAAWALRTGEALTRAVTGADAWYVDLNRVGARWLADPPPEIAALIADARSLAPLLPGLSWGYRRAGEPRERVETTLDPAEIRAHPGMIPIFAGLRLLSSVRLLGGFRQVEYVERLAEVLSPRLGDRGVPGGLLTGRLVGDGPIHPLDLYRGLVPRSELPARDTPMGRLWGPIAAALTR